MILVHCNKFYFRKKNFYKFQINKCFYSQKRNYEESFILTPSAPKNIQGSIIWIPGISGFELNFENFQELWFLSMKPKVKIIYYLFNFF
jgi:hypothetical protein